MQFLKLFILEGDGVPPKHVGVNRRLSCRICSMCICWFYTEKSNSILDLSVLVDRIKFYQSQGIFIPLNFKNVTECCYCCYRRCCCYCCFCCCCCFCCRCRWWYCSFILVVEFLLFFVDVLVLIQRVRYSLKIFLPCHILSYCLRTRNTA